MPIKQGPGKIDWAKSDILYFRLKLPRKIHGASYVGELAERGCPVCGGRLYAEGSTYFGLLRCSKHKTIWHWIPTFRERDGYAPYKWKNEITGECSREWQRRFPEGR